MAFIILLVKEIFSLMEISYEGLLFVIVVEVGGNISQICA